MALAVLAEVLLVEVERFSLTSVVLDKVLISLGF
jgi:hypothetical protein